MFAHTPERKRMVLEAQEAILMWDSVSDERKKELFAGLLQLILAYAPSTWFR